MWVSRVAVTRRAVSGGQEDGPHRATRGRAYRLEHDTKDDKPRAHVCLPPLPSLRCVELERLEARVRHQKPVNIRDVVHGMRLGIKAKSGEDNGLEAQIDASTLGTALLIRAAQPAKCRVPRRPGRVERAADRLAADRMRLVGGDQSRSVIGVLVVELARAVAEEFVDADLHLEGLTLKQLEESLISWCDERDGLVARSISGLQHVPKRDVLEAVALADVVVVWYVDAERYT